MTFNQFSFVIEGRFVTSCISLITEEAVFLLRIFTYTGTVTKVVDGDTFEAVIDLGFTISVRKRFRMLGINAPEMHGPEAAEGEKSKEWLAAQIEGKEVSIECHGQEKYGRWLAVVLVNGENLNNRIVTEGLARVYGM